MNNTCTTESSPLLAGVTPFSSCDWPGRLVATVFVAGCPWRCGYCHNPGLQARDAGRLSWSAVRSMLAARVGFLDGVVFSGGEATLAPQLADWMREARQLGLDIGLHTGGIYPQRLAALKGLVDWIGLDIKAAPGGVDAVTGVPGSESRMWQALDVALEMGADCGTALECRTTLDPRVMAADSLHRLAATLQARGVTHAALQQGRDAKGRPLFDAAQWPGRAVLDDWQRRFCQFSWRHA
ncbi:anaerobic ribonucleoside-triphosphate reductase activating protein [Aquitalea sp. LB_tupeE]|uniref:anaerobic ribonucleoside-triphosphate reductase activating protein n=1 Tax=Aquitalea sp. LB_tupeE TaxID=2748078 RepID=UPI0015C09065|nr:anaerobic ribonucleoside-triphosphate reductase activating protein [Aquitalea sp. LB_tupeE]NWK79916.1 anaerobic ribonucleoside-triphosphate reductase activating protein [Aquitalea sp. LB_tupeE]